jgi:hypothetical protein
VSADAVLARVGETPAGPAIAACAALRPGERAPADALGVTRGQADRARKSHGAGTHVYTDAAGTRWVVRPAHTPTQTTTTGDTP